MSEVQPVQPDTFDDPIDAAEIFGDDAGPQMTEEEQIGALEQLAKLAEELKAAEADALEKEIKLAEVKGRIDKLKSSLIPNLMDKIGLESFKLKDGAGEVTVKKDIKCGLTEERKPAGLKWIRDNGHGGIIKTAVSLQFDKGEEAKVEEARKVLVEAGFTPECADNVHAQTLKAFVKERIEAGDNIPLQTFGVFEFKEAKISLPKPKKKK
jgi:hypothetical protein